MKLCETVMNEQCTTKDNELCETLHEKKCEQCSTTSMEERHIEYDTVVEIVPRRKCKHVQEEVCTRISLQLVAAPVLPMECKAVLKKVCEKVHDTEKCVEVPAI